MVNLRSPLTLCKPGSKHPPIVLTQPCNTSYVLNMRGFIPRRFSCARPRPCATEPRLPAPCNHQPALARTYQPSSQSDPDPGRSQKDLPLGMTGTSPSSPLRAASTKLVSRLRPPHTGHSWQTPTHSRHLSPSSLLLLTATCPCPGRRVRLQGHQAHWGDLCCSEG